MRYEPIETSLIVTSYNQPNALALMFEGVLTQRHRIEELVIADDGSASDTKELVKAFTARAGFPVIFTHQEDRGFRKARALNNAVRESHGDYILFLDGDCIPPPEWAQRHVAALRSGCDFATAGYVLMSLERTRTLSRDHIVAGRLDEEIRSEERRDLRTSHRKELLYAFLRKRKKPKILGGNWAVTRNAIFSVNGFDENFDGFTKEDSDIRNRLRNAGFKGRSLWDRNWVYHCSHEFDPRRTLPEVVRMAPDRRYYHSRRHATVCDRGLRQENTAS
jgi:glycosyltransferase involved in cell wall biosynthesis